MRSESTPQEETYKWPVSDHLGCVSHPRLLTCPLPQGLWSPSVPLPHFRVLFDPRHHARG